MGSVGNPEGLEEDSIGRLENAPPGLKALVLAGGKGQRLQAVTGDEIPKCMVDVLGKPLLERQFEHLRANGVDEVFLAVGHLKDKVISYFGDGSRFGMRISYIEENEPLGTAGALFYLKGKARDDFLVVFADTVFSVDIPRMLAFHKSHGAAITLLVHPNSHPQDSDLVEIDSEGRVLDLHKKTEPRPERLRNCANASFFVLSPKILDDIDEPKRMDLEKDVVKERIKRGDVCAYRSSEYIKDAGTPQRLEQVRADLESGIVEARNLSRTQSCVFLDRDGTLNKSNGFISKPDDLVLNDGAAQAVRKLNGSALLAIVVTNQPVVARGECSEEELDSVHARLDWLLAREAGAYVDALYYCPHHPDSGFPGERRELKVECSCRKPATGLFLKARSDFNIDFASSYVIGDSLSDIIPGNALGMTTILITDGSALSDESRGKWLDRGCEAELLAPDAVFPDISSAVEFALENSKGRDAAR